MDTDNKLRKILSTLSGGRLEDVADRLIALFREPAWWEEAFEQQCVARGSKGALQDDDTCDAVKAFIRALLTRTQHEEQQRFLKDLARLEATFYAVAERPEETAAAMQRAAGLLHELRQKYGTPPAEPDRL